MGGYSHLFPSGQFPRFIFSWFCVPVYNAVLCRAVLASRLHHCVLPVAFAVLATQKRHVITCSTEQSSFARIFCARSRFPYKLFSAREFCRGELFSSELCSSTSEIEQSSRLLCSRSRDDLSSKGRPTELRAVCCATVVWWST